MAVRGPILLVDDDESYRAIVRHHLEEVGISVVEAEDGAKAYRMFSEKPTDVVILDLVMPNREGLETISRLRREGFRTKILAISGASQAHEYLRLASYLGADAEMDKTRPISDLLETVQSLLNDVRPAG